MPYHAGMSAEERRAVEAALLEGRVRVVAATSAFGLGMDFPLLRWAILASPPTSLLALAQAAGRVGRSGREADAYVLWHREDFRLLEWAFRSDLRARDEAMSTLRFLEERGCRVAALSRYFEGESKASQCGGCDACAASSDAAVGAAAVSASDENTLKIDMRSASIFQNGFHAIHATKCARPAADF